MLSLLARLGLAGFPCPGTQFGAEAHETPDGLEDLRARGITPLLVEMDLRGFLEVR